jgi:phage gp29-like protein
MALVDSYGRELKDGKPVLGEIGAWHGHSYPSYPSRGLTPESLGSIFMEADRGEISRQSELYEEMEEKDAHLGAVLATRKLAVAGLGWEIVPAGESSDDLRVAALVREALEDMDGIDDALMDLLDAVGKGFSVMEIIWELRRGNATVRTLKWLSHRAFTFARPDGDVLTEPRLLTEAEPHWGEELLPGKFVVHRFRGRSGLQPRAGVMRPCAWMYLFKHYTLKDWLVFCERYAQPMRVGKFGPGASESERRVLRDAVFNMGSDAAAVISDSTVIELLDSGQKGTAEIYEALASYCDRSISKAVLGQTLTTEHSTGTYAASRVHDSVRKDLVEADARALAHTLTTQLIRPLVLYNFGPETPLPRLRFEGARDDDMRGLAETLKTLKEMGIEIPARYVHERFGIPMPEGGTS